jgi:alcohol dehydrogenase
MRAAYITGYGKNKQLQLGDFPAPTVGDQDLLIEIHAARDQDLLIEIHAASVNPIDFKIRDGQLRLLRSYPFPLILGHDLAGKVTAIGKGVTRFKVGDEVYSRPRNGRIGTFAELISVDQSEVALKPANVSFSQAAGVPLVGLTAWQALVDVAQVKPGSRVFIQAGAGGVGSFAIQLAKHLGAHVTTTASKANEALVKSLGADEIVDYRSQKFEAVVRDQDVVLDTLGGEALYKSFPLLKPGGYLVSISGDPDARVAKEFGLGKIKTALLGFVGRKAQRLAKEHGVHYRFVFMKPNAQELQEITRLIEAGKIKPLVDREFSLTQAQDALAYSETGRAKGKIIVRVKP